MFADAFYRSDYYKELCDLANELTIRCGYEHTNVKWYVVYVWNDELNVFDIWKDEVTMYLDDHKIPEKAMKIIRKIQTKLKEIDERRLEIYAA